MGFLVGVYFDVLVGEALVFERDPDALDKGAECTTIQLEVILFGVIFDRCQRIARGFLMVRFLGRVAALYFLSVILFHLGLPSQHTILLDPVTLFQRMFMGTRNPITFPISTIPIDSLKCVKLLWWRTR